MRDSSTDVRYPIGHYEPQPFSEEQKAKWLADIQFLPNDVEIAIQTLDEHQLDTPYREGGWTVKQLVHHIADSHMNAYIRFKLGLTESNPTIKPYDEAAWAVLDDIQKVPINVSVTLLHALHRRWLATIENLTEADFRDKTVFHPAMQREMSLWFMLGMYSWHGRHHVAHIKALKELKVWH